MRKTIKKNKSISTRKKDSFAKKILNRKKAAVKIVAGFFAVLSELSYRKKPEKKPKRRIAIRQRSLGEFLSKHKARSESHGKLYWKRYHFSLLLKKIRRLVAKFLIIVRNLSWRMAISFGALLLIFSMLPHALSAPKSVSVEKIEQWRAGNNTTLDVSDKDGAIQLQPDGSWNARVWGVPQKNYTNAGFSDGSSSVRIGDDIYITKGGGTRVWMRYNTKRDAYDTLAELPFPVSSGADMGYDGANLIYMTFGAYSKKFYAFNISTETFSELPQTLDTICSGSNVESDGASIFVNRGCGGTDFWKFKVSDSTWENLAPVPGVPSTGASLVLAANGNFYLTRGASTKNFYSYNIASNTWTTRGNSPDFPRFSGAAMNLDQKGTFYHNNSNNKDYVYYINTWAGTPTSGVDNGVYTRYSFMIRYNITDNVWSTWNVVDDAPVPNVNVGSMQFNPDDGLLYVFRGDVTYDLWKFNPLGGSVGVGTEGSWIGPQVVNGGQSNSVNASLGTGSDVIWNGVTGAGGYLYVIRGGNNNQFYRFDISANTWSQLSNLPVTINSDVKGTYFNGYVYYLRGGSSNEFYRYNVSANTWSVAGELANLPATASDGATLAYNDSDGYIYATRGSWSSSFYRYNISTNTWTSMASISSAGIGFSNNGALNGGRIISNGTDIYAMPGGGESVFLKYATGTNTWSALSRTPFIQYYGTDMTFANGKIYALAGYYRDETWEYAISNDTWRKLPPIKEVSYGRGPYSGASLEYVGGNSFYATLGQGLTEMLSLTVSSNNYASQGVYVSEPMDLSQVESFVSFTKNDSVPANASVTYETRTSSDGKDWNAWQAISGTSIQSLPLRYVQVRITLISLDRNSTPKVTDWSISYNNEDALPLNPNAIIATSSRIGGSPVISGNTYPDEHPYFSWSGAMDAGAGVAGYYVYFGINANADPIDDGVYQSSASYEANEPLQDGAYYLRIKTKDNNGNVSANTWDAFTYLYGGVSPTLSVSKTVKADFDEGENTDISTSAIDGSIRLSSTQGFWNEGRVSPMPTYSHYGAKLAKTVFNGTTYFFATVGNNRPGLYRYDPATDQWLARASAPANIHYGGGIVAGPSGYLYAAAGYATATFMRYDIAQDQWQMVSSAPQNFTYGGTLTYDGSRYIYATPGGDNSIFRYDTINNNWVTLGTIDFNNPEFTYQSIGNGGDAVFDGNNTIYMTQGNGSPYFAKYTINDNASSGEVGRTWTALSPSLMSSSNGGSMSYDSQTNSVYLLTGWSKNYLYRYDISSDTWTRLPDCPATIAYGASSIIDGRYMYVLKGEGDTTFLRYNLDENSWDLPQRGVFATPHISNGNYYGFGGGVAMTQDENNNAYVIRGNWDTSFNRYNPLSGKSEELAPLPIGAIDGAQIAYVPQDNAVYYVASDYIQTRRVNSKSNYFFKYDIATNTWQELVNDLPPVQVNNSGVSLVYDGSRFLYLTRAGGGSTWWRYDRQATSGSRWMNHLGQLNTALPTISGWSQGTGSRLLFKNNIIYSTKAQNTNEFYGYNTGTNAWVKLANIPGNISNGGALVDGSDGYLYLTQGGNLSGYYRYKILDNSWEALPSIPAQVSYGGGGAGMFAGGRVWVVAGTGTNTYSDGLYSYVVSSDANSTGFKKSGTYVSEPLDLIKVYGWGNISLNYTQPANTFVMVETRTSDDGGSWSDWAQANNEHAKGNIHTFSIASPANEFIQVRLTLSSTDQVLSPQVDDWTISYYQDIQAPVNPSQISSFSNSAKTININSNTWYNYQNPVFEWPVAEQANGASDGVGGSGVAGYYVYFGTIADADPFLLGLYQTQNTFAPSNLVSDNTYYLKITTIDNAGMVPSSYFEAFAYKFDNTVPVSPSDISVTPSGFTATDQYEFLWNSDAADISSGLLKLQYRTDGDAVGIWYDINDIAKVSLTLPNVDHIVGAYQPGKNKFYVRAADNAGNVSIPIEQDYYYSATAPSPPRDLVVSPENSTDNEFSFSWNVPESFVGDVSKIKYRYSINTLPNDFNTVETTVMAAGPGPFATQKGINRFYVVAVDEADKVDYSLYSYVDFDANTSAPSVPTNIQIFDTSDRETAEYSIAVKWVEPENINKGNFAGFTIYRSQDNVSFEEIATTTGSAYVDSKLSSKTYYYYVKTKDKTNNFSIASTVVNMVPTGKYTHPPKLVGTPSVSIQSFQSDVTWATDRSASSFVEYGKSIDLGQTTGQVDSLTDHEVIVKGLEADTKYFYRVKYIDPDGNIGTSEVDTFTTLEPPTISEVVVNDIQLNTAYVSWKTNMSATCTLDYNGSGSSMNIKEETGGSNHVQKIDKLAAATSYSVQISCEDGDLNIFESDEYSFSTPQEPTVSNVTVENKENVDLPTITVQYTTNVPTTTYILFKGAKDSSPHTYLVNDRVTEHTAEISGLDPAVEYDLQISGVDEHSIQAKVIEQKITTRFDSRPPTIVTNRAIGRVMGRGKSAQANIYIRIETDEPTKIRVGYAKGIVTKSFEQTAADDSFNTYHLITIPAETGQVYSYQISAFDEAENLTTSESITIAVDQSRANATEVITSTFLNQFGWISRLGKN